MIAHSITLCSQASMECHGSRMSTLHHAHKDATAEDRGEKDEISTAKIAPQVNMTSTTPVVHRIRTPTRSLLLKTPSRHQYYRGLRFSQHKTFVAWTR